MVATSVANLAALPLPTLIGGILVVALAAAVFVRATANLRRGNSPPVEEGVPFVGGLLKFSKGPWHLMKSMHSKYGEVFTVPLAHKRMTFLLGPHASPHFFNATDERMSQTEVYSFNVPTFGEGVVFDVDQRVRSEQFRFVADALRSSKLKTYVPAFRQEAEDFFAAWGDTGVVNLAEVFGELIILTASRTLMGREVRESMFKRVADLFHDLDDGMRPLSVLFPYLPTAYHRKRDAARAALSDIFKSIIAARRASGVSEDDVLQALIDSRYKKVYDGRATTDQEIVGLLIALLFAGQHTSSITSTWTGLYMMAGDQKYYKAAEEEQRRVIAEHGTDITFDVLNELDTLHNCIQEALRLQPPLVLLMRYAKEPFEVTTSDGRSYVVPKGDIVATSPSFSHRLKHVFKDADSFQPERFRAPREEDKAAPFSYIGFGGGRHGCMGSQFAYLQIKTIWSVLLRNFTFELVDEFPEPDWDSMVIGPKPTRVRYTRRRL
ncbi:CYP51G1 [Auxenochlorella protothecoides x Auxenochlorella symbiontica]|uniref:Obtusifoliol 14-alpha demethylase n=2 Tax=Auxenochlorella protothecoides TaxID=3075 RepID=A0A087SHY3_AUXPR